ncbi:MAG: hypothetical protein ABFS18_09955 [Thermodesulfobacteriota bacterium]
MKKNVRKRIFTTLLAVTLSWGIMVPFAAAVDMVAESTTVTMPGGEVVTMWGYAVPAEPAYDTAFGPNGPPVIKLTAGATLTINLTNNLAEETSIVIPGQQATETNAMVPTWTDGTTGNRGVLPANLLKRVRSFTHEAAAAGSDTYSWGPLKAGTYLIQSGTHPAVQVQMGLYAVLIVDEVADAEAYPGIAYSNEVTLLFSEIDPYLHAAVAGGTYGSTYVNTMQEGYRPRYFLINGQPYSADRSPIAAGVDTDTTILRFLNAGLRDREPIVQGGVMSVVAEDGNPTPFAGAVQQYSIDLAPGKTMDATFSPLAAFNGYVPVYDRRLGLSNDGASPGGMVAMLEIGPATHTLDVVVDPLGTGTGNIRMVGAPGGIDTATLIPDSTEDLLAGTEVTLHGTGAPGSTLTGWTVLDSGGLPTLECQKDPLTDPDPYGDCVVVMDQNKTVTATFTSYPAVTLIGPNGGETIAGGSGYTIAWGAPADAVTFTLGYSFGAGSPWKTIATGVTGDRYVWVIPETVPNHGDLYVAVIGYDATGALVGKDTSDVAAQRNSIALTTPSASGIVLSASGDVTYDITWASSMVSGTVANIGIWYQTAPGMGWKLITVLANDTGSYTWTIPVETTTEALVGVIFYDALGEVLYLDVSDNVFEMAP